MPTKVKDTVSERQDPYQESSGDRIPESVIQYVMERDEGKCQVTGDNTVELHHVKFRSQGGKHVESNLVLLSPEIHRKIHEGNLAITEFDPDEDRFVVVNTDTGELVEPIWWFDKPSRDADEAHHLFKRIKRHRKGIANFELSLGKFFCRLDDGDMWESLDHDSEESFYGDPEVDIARSTAYRYKKVYRRFVAIDNVAGVNDVVNIGIRKCDMIAQFYDDKNFDEWIAKAKNLSRSDLREEIDVYKGVYSEEEEDESENSPEPGWVTRARNLINDLSEEPDSRKTILRIKEIMNDQLEKLDPAGKA